MNHKFLTSLAVALSALSLCANPARAQGTAFTYQGSLHLDGAPANGNYDFQFILFSQSLFGNPASSILTNANVSVSNGLFTTTLDFGDDIFGLTNNWLDISVRTNGGGAFTELSPRQLMTPAPYAINAVTAANLAGVVANNSIQAGVSIATISGGSGNTIQSGANAATVSGGQNNGIGLNSSISVIAGGAGNSIGSSDDTSTISGGNGNIIQNGAGVSTIAGGVQNEIQTAAPRSVISGGSNNQIETNAQHSFIGGGGGNAIEVAAAYSVIDGGNGNQIQLNSYDSTIGGGIVNVIGQGDAYSTISGGAGLSIQTNSFASTIGGGYQNGIQSGSAYSTIGGGLQNLIETNNDYSTISGGAANNIGDSSFYSTVVGGYGNVIQPNASGSAVDGTENVIDSGAYASTISGGEHGIIGTNSAIAVIDGGEYNQIGSNSPVATIGGGGFNAIMDNAQLGTISGGERNAISDYATYATIGGGGFNTNEGNYATIPGGGQNIAAGNYSFAAGLQAQALHQGAFVWADSQDIPFASTANNQFLVQAAGGVGVNMNNPGGASLYVQGNRAGGAFNDAVSVFENTNTSTGFFGSAPALRVVVDGGDCLAGALSVSDNGTGPIAEFGNANAFVASVENDGTIISKGVTLTSDKNAKENFTALDARSVLAKVAALPVTQWNYKTDSAAKKHIGPVAQDFAAAFGLNGDDDKHISVIDEGGVAFAAIQGLNQKVEEKNARIQEQSVEISELKSRLAKLEQLVNQKLGGSDAP